MAFSLSPGVNVSEIDLTTIVPAVSTTVGALGGVFTWGPVEDRTLVTSEDDLRAKFGGPTANNFETWFTGANFLAYASSLQVARAAANAHTAVAGPTINAASNAAVTIKNLSDFEAQFPAVSNGGTYLYAAKYPGSLGNSLRVAVCDSANAFNSTLTGSGNNTVTFSFTVGSNVAVMTVTNSAADIAAANTAAAGLIQKIGVNDYLKAGNTVTGTQFMQVTATANAAVVNTSTVQTSISLETPFTLASNVAQTTIDRYWEFYSLVDQAPGTSNYVADRNGAGDEMHVVVVDDDGKFTGTAGEVLEVWPALSRATDAIGEQGGSTYYQNVINQGSGYIWALADRAGSASGAATSMTALSTAPLSLPFWTGTDGLDESTIDLGSLARAYNQFQSSEDVDISLVLQGKARGGVLDSQLAIYLVNNIAEYRKDCVVFISPRREAVVNNYGAIEEDVVAYFNQIPSTSYAMSDSGYKYQYDKYNDVYRWVPLNGDVAGLAVRSDTSRDAWWSFAGFNRGQIKNVVKLAWNPNQARRDFLYKNRVNPVVTFPGEGTILYGDKTLLAKPSAFDRINVRRLFIVMEKAIAIAAKYTLFEFNDEFTRAQFRNMVEPYLRDIMGRRGIYAFKVVCDETNNTPDVIDSNQFVGTILIKPARAINYITLSFVAVRTGVDFTEIAGSF